jgi:hypothetical protein
MLRQPVAREAQPLGVLRGAQRDIDRVCDCAALADGDEV